MLSQSIVASHELDPSKQDATEQLNNNNNQHQHDPQTNADEEIEMKSLLMEVIDNVHNFEDDLFNEIDEPSSNDVESVMNEQPSLLLLEMDKQPSIDSSTEKQLGSHDVTPDEVQTFILEHDEHLVDQVEIQRAAHKRHPSCKDIYDLTCVSCGYVTCIKGILTKKINKSSNYICKNCDKNPSELTKEFYLVERIEGHRIEEDGRRSFKIKWDGFVRRTWSLEKDLRKCASILKKYIDNHNSNNPNDQLAATFLPQKGGGVSLTTDNFKTMDEVFHIIRQYENMRVFKTEIEILRFDGQLRQHAVTVVLLDEHFYVVMSINNRIFVADTTNQSNKRAVNQKLRKHLNIQGYDHVSYYEINNKDFCAVGAIALALAFKRTLNHRKIPCELRLGRGLVNKLISQIYESSTKDTVLPTKFKIGEKAWNYCNSCKKPFKQNQNLERSNHQRICEQGTSQEVVNNVYSW
jgi:translation initiation factor 2 beta subunit (eIF-2beta)/eIF-5